MDYEKVLAEVIRRFDLESDGGRRKAFARCVDYADRNLREPFDYNEFMKCASEKLGQMTVLKTISPTAIEMTGEERVQAAIAEDGGVVLTGNRAGLGYLAKVFNRLKNTRDEEKELRLNSAEVPLREMSESVTIRLIDDEGWYHKMVGQGHEAEREAETGGWEMD